MVDFSHKADSELPLRMGITLGMSDILHEISEQMAEKLTKTWRSLDEAKTREAIKERLRVAIASALVEELSRQTMVELGR